MTEEKVLEKIKKLFALASNNPNEHESESAMKMAKKMLDKHNLSMLDLKTKDSVSLIFKDGPDMPWFKIMFGAICKLYDCKYVMDKTDKPIKHLIIGSESNRITAAIVIDYVVEEIRREGKGMGAGFRNAMAYGVNDQVVKILIERNKSKEEIIPGTGLVPADLSKVAIKDADDWVNKNIGNTTKQKRAKMSYNDNGFNSGKNLNLNPRLSNKRALN